MEYVSFDAGLLEPAADLVAARQRLVRERFPLIPKRYEDPAHALSAVKAAWDRENASGTAAVLGNRLVGFLFGDITTDSLRGRALWVRTAGHALANDQSPELMRDLYQHSARHWVERESCFKQYTLAFALPEMLEPWQNLVFAREQAYAIKDLNETPIISSNGPAQLEIRRATAADSEMFRDFSTIISGTQSQSPAWVPVSAEHVEQMRVGYAGVPGDNESQTWIALMDGQPVGFFTYFEPENAATELHIPENAIELKIAGTLSPAQGRGVATALLNGSLRKLREQGHKSCLADWHIPNLLSSRFWPKRGFEPVLYRMKRVVDERILGNQVQIP